MEILKSFCLLNIEKILTILGIYRTTAVHFVLGDISRLVTSRRNDQIIPFPKNDITYKI